MAVAVNFILFQAGWFACVLGAARGFPWQGALAGLLIAGWIVSRSKHPRGELALVAVAAVAGFAFDSALALAGWVDFEGAVPAPLLAPVWMVALWALFATTLNVSLRWLREWPALGVLFGAVGGPVAYYAGERLGALQFTDPMLGLAAVAAGWALATPLLFALARRLEAT
ncbi:MAG: DUF2878 domain-containing protein [Betaproteobacteria bacterium]